MPAKHVLDATKPFSPCNFESVNTYRKQVWGVTSGGPRHPLHRQQALLCRFLKCHHPVPFISYTTPLSAKVYRSFLIRQAFLFTRRVQCGSCIFFFKFQIYYNTFEFKKNLPWHIYLASRLRIHATVKDHHFISCSSENFRSWSWNSSFSRLLQFQPALWLDSRRFPPAVVSHPLTIGILLPR